MATDATAGSPPRRVLVVEDDAGSRDVAVEILRQGGYAATGLDTAEGMLAAVRADPPDLVLLDLGLPGMQGLEALGRLRDFSDVPVLILSGRVTPQEKARGLLAGADDYLGRPFDMVELLARVKARLRPPRTRRILTVGALTLDLARQEARWDDVPVGLTQRQFGLLALLAGDPGRVRSREEILQAVWGSTYVSERNVIEQVRLLRTRLGAVRPDAADLVQTVPGRGYRIADQPAPAASAPSDDA